MNCPSNKLKTVVSHYADKISAIYPEKEAETVVWMMIEHFFGVNRMMLALNQDLLLNESELLIIHDASKNILQYVPIQYVIGKTDFCGLSLKVNTSTLIPRPETEQLTHLVIKALPRKPLRILDIGTGTGCIAITLKKNRPDCKVFACDISQEVLQTAKENAEKHNTTVHFFHCDILSENDWLSVPKIDIMVSNPPYVCLSEKSVMRPNVLLHEPETALFVVDENPLLFYKSIAKMAVDKLIDGGKLFFEINERFGNEMAELLRKFGFGNVVIEKDFHGKERFAMGKWDVRRGM